MEYGIWIESLEDIAYLSMKGALTVPDASLQSALVKAFVEYVYPYMPLLDLYDFLKTINYRCGRSSQVSLFLYHAVLFSAAAFVDVDVLHCAGFASRKQAREVLFNRTRLIYDFDYESDSLTLVQGLLLMTWQGETNDGMKDMWHWLGIAIAQAKSIGLHTDPTSMDLPHRMRSLRKRIWWCCFTRDHLIALRTRQPARIEVEGLQMPMLQESDFDSKPPLGEELVGIDRFILLQDVFMQKQLASLCIHMVQLCIIIDHVLARRYFVNLGDNKQWEDTVHHSLKLLPKKMVDNPHSVVLLDDQLLDWANSLTPSCKDRPMTELDSEKGWKTVALHRTMLHMLFYTTVMTLHRPQLLSVPQVCASNSCLPVLELSWRRVREATMGATHLVTELHQMDLDGYLPLTGVTVVTLLMATHIFEMERPARMFYDYARDSFQECSQILEKLRETYVAADIAAVLLGAASRKLPVGIDSLSSLKAPTQASSDLI
ncbi:cutinase transcription factor 1 beta [Fusarium proliferatum]|nr:cutinase transcription factor 1 beta [Fusarium proliferatum]